MSAKAVHGRPRVVVRRAAYCLVHVPDLVRYGSKPRRETARDPAVAARLRASLRSETAAVCYPPNQTFIGNLTPQELAALPTPWFQAPTAPTGRTGYGRAPSGRFAARKPSSRSSRWRMSSSPSSLR